MIIGLAPGLRSCATWKVFLENLLLLNCNNPKSLRPFYGQDMGDTNVLVATDWWSWFRLSPNKAVLPLVGENSLGQLPKEG